MIEVGYEMLPAVFDENEAISGNAPIIHDEPDMEGAHNAERNIVQRIEAEVGDFAAGLKTADHVLKI